MTEYARLVVAVDSRQVPKATSDMDRMAGAAGRLEGVVKSAGAAVIGMVSIQAIRSAQRLSEQFVLLEARVRRMSESAEQAEITYGRLAEIARKSGTDMGDTVRLWESLTGTLRELGANDAQIVRLTETLQKIGTVGGSSAEEMSNALRQLGQGLAGGTLRAEEFNAIIEGMPELARQIAKGLGVPFGELRQLMQDGELTAERVLGAIQNRAMEVDAEFAKLPRTVAQASAALTNDLGNAIAALDKAIGGSSSLAKFLDVLAKGIRFTAGDLTDFERLNELTAERASLEKSFEQAQRRTLLSAKEREAYEKNFARINAEIKEIQDRRIEQQKQESQQIKSDGSARNEQYDKYLAKLEESAALQGVNSEAAKVRYAIEAGELGKLQPEQEAALLKYAEEIDAKRSAEQATKELANSSKQLEQSYASLVQSLERQLSMYGATSEAAKVRYELESGSLQGVVGQQANYLIGLAQELDAKRDLTEQEKIRIDILRESGQLRAANDAQFQLEYAEKIAEYERQGNVEALQRLETLRRIREVQMNADQAPGTVEGVTKAPNSGVVSPEIGGAASEFMRLQEQATQLEEWRATELEKQRGFLEAKAINEEQYAERIRNIQEQHQQQVEQLEQARYQVSLSSATDLFGNLADITAQFAGEQSGIYKAMFIAQKAFAIAQSMIAIQQGIALAAANPWPLNLGAMASVAAATAGLVSNIASVGLSFDGGGYTGNGPRSGGLDGKGGFLAMMHPQETVIDHTKQRGGSGNASDGGNVVVNLVEDSSRAGHVEQTTGPDGEKVLQLWVAKIRAGGTPEALALEQAYGLKRAGR
jgi:tape measure domain-containing protein